MKGEQGSDQPSNAAVRELTPESDAPLKLLIEPIIARAEEMSARLSREFPKNPGICRASREVVRAAYKAQRLARKRRRVFGWHRGPALVLVLGLLGLSWGLYRVLLQPVQVIIDPTRQLTPESASGVLEGVGALLDIVVDVVIVVVAVLGVDTVFYRRVFNDLNTIISLISMHQSNKEILGCADPVQRQVNLRYLDACSDLLGLVSVLAGFYSQENPALLFNNTAPLIHQRANYLKITIRAKMGQGFGAGMPHG